MTQKLTLLLCVLCASPVSSRGAEQPNVVFILADDLGWSDTMLYGTNSIKHPISSDLQPVA